MARNTGGAHEITWLLINNSGAVHYFVTSVVVPNMQGQTTAAPHETPDRSEPLVCQNNQQGVEGRISITILVDVSERQRKVLPAIIQATAPSAHDLIADRNCGSVISFGGQIREVQPLTPSEEKLSDAINGLAIEGFNSKRVDRAPSKVYDSIYLALTRDISSTTTQKVFIILAEGNDVGSSMPFKKVLQTAIDNRVRCYSVLVAKHSFSRFEKHTHIRMGFGRACLQNARSAI